MSEPVVVVVAVPGPVGVDPAAVQAGFAEKLVLVRDLLGMLVDFAVYCFEAYRSHKD